MKPRSRLRISRKRGIILALALLVSGVGLLTTVGTAAQRMKETRLTISRNDAIVARQAAQAGLDLGLLYYKYNHNVQLASGCEGICNATLEPTQSTGNPFRIFLDRLGCASVPTGRPNDNSSLDLDTGKCLGVPITKTDYNNDGQTDYYINAPTNPQDQRPIKERIVDLRVWFKDKTIGDPTKFNDPNYTNNPTLAQDEVYQFDNLDQVYSMKIHLAPKDWAKKREEFKKINGHYPEPWIGSKEDYAWANQAFCKQQTVQTNIQNKDLCAYYLIKIPKEGVETIKNDVIPLRRPFGLGYENSDNDLELKLYTFVKSLRISPLNMDLQFAISDVRDSNNNIINIDTGITHIESTGYYGSVKIKLEAQINRKTNAYLGIFDRSLYTTEGGLK